VCRILGPDGEQRLPNPLTVETLARELGVLVAGAPPLHAVAVTGGEPLSQVDFIEAWLETAPPRLPILLETAGILPARLARLLPLVAIVSLDFKCPSNTGERPRWDEHEACLRAAVAARCEVYVKVPVDATTDPAEVERGARIVAAIDARVPVFLTPLTEPESPRLTIEPHDLARLQAVASAHVADVRVLPQLHKVLGIP
jgi:pyruvate-formate lyase-activating enzyme